MCGKLPEQSKWDTKIGTGDRAEPFILVLRTGFEPFTEVGYFRGYCFNVRWFGRALITAIVILYWMEVTALKVIVCT